MKIDANFDFDTRQIELTIDGKKESFSAIEGFWNFNDYFAAWSFAIYDVLDDFDTTRYLIPQLPAIDDLDTLRVIRLKRKRWDVKVTDLILSKPRFSRKFEGNEYAEIIGCEKMKKTKEGFAEIELQTKDLEDLNLKQDRIMNERGI